MTTQQTPIRCSNCGHQYAGKVTVILDVGKAPHLKTQLLNDTLNNSQCPQCGMINKMLLPLLYHDPAKELLIAMVPMELHAGKTTQERIIGELMNQLSKENFKGYMFNPRRALTTQGLVDQILQADGINPEEWRKTQQRQREQIDIIQKFMQAESEEEINRLITDYDSAIDASFFQTMSIMAQNLSSSGRSDIAQQILMLQNALTSMSSYGQEMARHGQEILNEVADSIEQLGADASLENFMDLALEYIDMPQHLQTLVTIARPVFDYQFFQQLTAHMGTLPAAAREKLEELRAKLHQITTVIDQRAQASATAFLQAVVNHTDPEAFIRQNISLVDANFHSILQASIQNAEQKKNQNMLTRLKEIDSVVHQIQQGLQSSTDFLRQILSSKNPEQLLTDNVEKIDDNLLTVLTLNIDAALHNGDQQAAERLQSIYQIIMALLQDSLRPDLKLIQDMLAAENEDVAMGLLEQRIDEFDRDLISVMEAVGRLLDEQGETTSVARLNRLTEAAKTVFE